MVKTLILLNVISGTVCVGRETIDTLSICMSFVIYKWPQC